MVVLLAIPPLMILWVPELTISPVTVRNDTIGVNGGTVPLKVNIAVNWSVAASVK